MRSNGGYSRSSHFVSSSSSHISMSSSEKTRSFPQAQRSMTRSSRPGDSTLLGRSSFIFGKSVMPCATAIEILFLSAFHPTLKLSHSERSCTQAKWSTEKRCSTAKDLRAFDTRHMARRESASSALCPVISLASSERVRDPAADNGYQQVGKSSKNR